MPMLLRIALAGNPNAGKTTLFNTLTGSSQFVGNWPGVTVEKKEGRLKQHPDVVVTDLPGIYSLSPYTPEEVVTRNYLVVERPDVILNIVDGTNLERNLYLTTQLMELGIPVVVAINMMDVVHQRGDEVDTAKLEKLLRCPVREISALKETGVDEAVKAALEQAEKGPRIIPHHSFSGSVEHAIAHIEERVLHYMPEEQQRWFAIKLFERDQKVLEQLKLDKALREHIEFDILACEAELGDDAESIIATERYRYIDSLVAECCIRHSRVEADISHKIDRVITNRWLALPIFAVIMFIVYYLSVTLVGSWASSWAHDGVFGDGWRLFGIGNTAYHQAVEDYTVEQGEKQDFLLACEAAGLDTSYIKNITGTPDKQDAGLNAFLISAVGVVAQSRVTDENGAVLFEGPVDVVDFRAALFDKTPNPADYGIWIESIPDAVGRGLEKIGTAPWAEGLMLRGIIAGVGAVLGFLPQMMVLFLLLAFLEACGYMSRIAFIMDRIFRRFGLSGKSIIPMIISSGCGVPGVLASRTIENDRDRRMTIMTATFIPCGAKLPLIAMIAGVLFGGAWWMAPSAYFAGIASVLISGTILKKVRLFTGEDSPFVMELPLYHMPTVKNVLRSMWERSWDFIRKAGTIILLSTIIVWFTSYFGWENGRFTMLTVQQMDHSILGFIGSGLAWIFAPQGWADWRAAVAAVTGLLAKENIVSTFSILYGGGQTGNSSWDTIRQAFSPAAGYSFLLFNLLCAPCFAAMSAIRQEMKSRRWFWFAIGYQTAFAYVVSLCVYQYWLFFSGRGIRPGTCVAAALTVLLGYLIARKPDNRPAGVPTRV